MAGAAGFVLKQIRGTRSCRRGTDGRLGPVDAGPGRVAAHSGWSVTIVGYSRAVTDAQEIRRLEQTGLDPWAPGERDHFIRISPEIVNGRRIAAQPLPEGSDASRV